MTDLQAKQRPGNIAIDGRGMRIGIACARWNDEVVGNLLKGCTDELLRLGVKNEDIVVVRVPGSYEVPMGAKRIIDVCQTNNERLDAVICIGCLIKGETMHFEYICEAVTQGIMKLGMESGIPVLFGVLACLNEEQALLRAGIETNGKSGHNHGTDWGSSAVEMGRLYATDSIEGLKRL
jgi:6,7-dimethyl-8-ribityllumazine synthase